MTKWEIGQDLIAISDFIGEKRLDMEEAGHKQVAKKLLTIQALVGDLFNQNNDHSFGILDSDQISEFQG